MNEYKIEHFDVLKILPGMVIVVVTALATTWGNTILSQPQWVKEGENFILFYPLLVGILLYGFSVGTVFSAGQTAWKDIVDLAEENNPELKKSPEAPTGFIPDHPSHIRGWHTHDMLVVCSDSTRNALGAFHHASCDLHPNNPGPRLLGI